MPPEGFPTVYPAVALGGFHTQTRGRIQKVEPPNHTLYNYWAIFKNPQKNLLFGSSPGSEYAFYILSGCEREGLRQEGRWELLSAPQRTQAPWLLSLHPKPDILNPGLGLMVKETDTFFSSLAPDLVKQDLVVRP